MQFSPNCLIPVNRLCVSENASFMFEGVTMETDGVAVGDCRKTLLGTRMIQKSRGTARRHGAVSAMLGLLRTLTGVPRREPSSRTWLLSIANVTPPS